MQKRTLNLEFLQMLQHTFTVVGIMLLLYFGGRAVQQASSIEAVRGFDVNYTSRYTGEPIKPAINRVK